KLVAAQMWSFAEIEVIDEESVVEALKEFANIVLGNTTTILSNNMGVKCDIKSPVVLHDKYIETNDKIKLHQVSIKFNFLEKDYTASLIFLHSV
ncbi:MAG TPA: chemotaxis protein CheX, partial [bacterium]|nr:chemotaxis protein CheX [bacterium]